MKKLATAVALASVLAFSAESNADFINSIEINYQGTGQIGLFNLVTGEESLQNVDFFGVGLFSFDVGYDELSSTTFSTSLMNFNLDVDFDYRESGTNAQPTSLINLDFSNWFDTATISPFTIATGQADPVTNEANAYFATTDTTSSSNGMSFLYDMSKGISTVYPEAQSITFDHNHADAANTADSVNGLFSLEIAMLANNLVGVFQSTGGQYDMSYAQATLPPVTPPATDVSEPSAIALMFAGLALLLRRKVKAKS